MGRSTTTMYYTYITCSTDTWEVQFSLFHLAIILSFPLSRHHSYIFYLTPFFLFITVRASVEDALFPFIAAPSHRVRNISPDILRIRAFARKRETLNKWLCWVEEVGRCRDKAGVGRRIDEV